MELRAFLSLVGGLLLAQAFTQVAPAIEWQKCLGGSNSDWSGSVQQTSDGGYIVAGHTWSNDGDVSGNHGSADFWVVRLDAAGALVWQNTLGGSAFDWAGSIRQTSDGGYIVAGNTESNDGDVTGNHGYADFWVVKLDTAGILVWQKALGGSDQDRAFSVQQTSDGGYIVAGDTRSIDGDVTGSHGDYDFWIVKLDATGLLQWQKALGGSLGDVARSILRTSSGGYMVAGFSASNDGDVTGNHGSYDFWVVNLDIAGSLVWQKTLGGSVIDQAFSIGQTSDGGYIVAGRSDANDGDVSGNHGSTDFWVVKLDAAGAIVWQKTLGGSASDWGNAVQQTSDGGYIVSGWTWSNDGDVSGYHGGEDFWVVKLDAAGALVWQKALGGGTVDHSWSIQVASDGGYVVCGETESINGDVSGNHGDGDSWVVKLEGLDAGVVEPNPSVFTISPNPGNGLVQVKCTREMKNATLVLTDAMGREVLQDQMNGSEHTLNLRSLHAGLYVLTLRSEKSISTQRLVVPGH